MLTVHEIQPGGDRVVRAVEQLVDADATPSRFLLARSTDFLTVPTISESPTGRRACSTGGSTNRPGSARVSPRNGTDT